jgi:hypothetical protein
MTNAASGNQFRSTAGGFEENASAFNLDEAFPFAENHAKFFLSSQDFCKWLAKYYSLKY